MLFEHHGRLGMPNDRPDRGYGAEIDDLGGTEHLRWGCRAATGEGLTNPKKVCVTPIIRYPSQMGFAFFVKLE